MMVGELTYEETFLAEGWMEELVFLVMVIILTTLLNNLLIGLTTSNVSELMEKAKEETTISMLRDILDYYGCKDPKLCFEENGKLVITNEIITSKILWNRIKKCERLKEKVLLFHKMWTISTSAEDLVEVKYFEPEGELKWCKNVP